MRRSDITRRALLAGFSTQLFAQGVASRGVRALPRGKPSGLPFPARFTDVAAAAGLHLPVIYGQTDKADYIVETTGCGVAFFDYDNDGWLDILVLNGSPRTPRIACTGTTATARSPTSRKRRACSAQAGRRA